MTPPNYPTAPFGPQGLREDSETLAYEFRNLRRAAQLCLTAQAAHDDDLQNVCVESFAIHFRALLDFFTAHRGGKGGADGTDVIAADFVRNWDISIVPAIMTDARKPANKQVAHITTARRGLNQRGSGKVHEWQIDALLRETAKVMGEFLRQVPAANMDPDALFELRALVVELLRTPIAPTGQHSIALPLGNAIGESVRHALSARTTSDGPRRPPDFNVGGVND